jgi:hypothetical protein
MHTMTLWWGSLVIFAQVFWGIALFGSAILIMQIISMFLGLEHFSHDMDSSVDIHGASQGSHYGGYGTDHGFMAGLKLFTMRNMVAFVCMFGWTGIVMLEYSTSKILICLIAFIVGCFAMFVMALAFKIVISLQTSGNINEASFVGIEASVYIAIPEKGKGIGKINFNIGGTLQERQAISKNEYLPVGAQVKTISYTNNIFTVEGV